MISQRHSEQSNKAQGFSLVELLIAAVFLLTTTGIAGQALISHLKGSQRIESLEQQRDNWNRTSSFIEADIALSERIFDLQSNPSLLSIPDSCSGEINSNNQLRLGLEQSKVSTPVIYFVKQSTSGWLADNTLWRCGPGFDLLGRPTSGTVQVAQILDGLDQSKPGGGFNINGVSPNGKEVSFELALRGHALNSTYIQEDATQARITPLFIRPSEYSYCTGNAFVKLEGTSEPEELTIQSGNIEVGEDILICGNGGGDEITGSDDANDILEAGETGGSTIKGMSGDDRLRGTNDPVAPDILMGGDGDDVLVGRSGDDLMSGGCGTNQYLPGAGNDSVQGDGHSYSSDSTVLTAGSCDNNPYDIVFMHGSLDDYSLSTPCNNQTCTVSKDDETSTDILNEVEVIIFNDARRDLANPSD